MQFHPALNQTSAEKNSNWVLTRLEAYERRHRLRAQVSTYVFASSWWWFQRQWKKVCSSNTFIIFPNVSIFNIFRKKNRCGTPQLWFDLRMVYPTTVFQNRTFLKLSFFTSKKPRLERLLRSIRPLPLLTSVFQLASECGSWRPITGFQVSTGGKPGKNPQIGGSDEVSQMGWVVTLVGVLLEQEGISRYDYDMTTIDYP